MQKGIEKSGLIWTIDEFAGDDILIRIYDKDGKLLVEHMYKCMHMPIFGLDADDVEQINKVLDKLLKECEEKDAAEDAIIFPSVRSKTGSWIIVNRDGVNKYVCSECDNEPLLIGESYPIFKLSDYCPYCGTKMEVKE